MDPQQARAQLSDLLSQLRAATATLEGEDAASTHAMSHVVLDRADTASALTDNGREEALIEAAGERIAEVQAALVRLDDGSWGVCVDCRNPIPEARLEVRPEAIRCVHDQARYESALSS